MSQVIYDLSGTTWYFNANPAAFVDPDAAMYKNYYINFKTAGNTNYTYIKLSNGSTAVTYEAAWAYNGSRWNQDTMRTITISGGDDATDKNLISYLMQNATLTSDYHFVLGDPLRPVALQYGSKNFQVSDSFGRATTSSYTSIISVTCAKTGKYNVYWWGYRSSTSGTSGSALYVNGTIVDSAYTTFDSTLTNVQKVKVTNVSLNKNDIVAVYARSRGSNYYMYVGNLTLEEL